MRVNGKPVMVAAGADGYVAVTRKWKKGDRIELRFKLEPRVVVGDHKNQGKVAVLYGPLVLAADEALLGATNRSLSAVSAAGASLAALGVTPEPAPDAVKILARRPGVPRQCDRPQAHREPRSRARRCKSA